MRVSTILLSLTLVFFCVTQAIPQSVKEDFSYAAGQSIDNLGTATNGWGSPWMIDTSVSHGMYPDTQLVVADTGFGYADLDYQYSHIGNHVNVIINGGATYSGARYLRSLENAWPDEKGEYWVSFLFEANKVPTLYTYYLVKLFSGSKELVGIGRGMGANVYSCGSGWIGSGGPDLSTTAVDAKTPVFLVTKIVLTGDAADSSAKTYMWINPDPSSTDLDTSVADVKRNTDMRTGFDRVTLEYGSQDTIQVAFDEIRLGTSFADVASEIPQVMPQPVQEDFAYNVGQSIDNQGTAKNGWGGPWMIDTSVSHGMYPDTQLVVADTGFGYGDLDYEYSHIGNHINVIINGGTTYSGGRYLRSLENVWPDVKGEYWVSFLFEANKAPTLYTYYLVKLFSGSKELVGIGRGMGANVYSCGSGWIGSGGPDLSTTAVDAKTPVFLVTKIILTGDAASDANAKTYMWINPDPSSTDLDTSAADVKRNTDLSAGFDKVALEYGSQDTIQVAFDEIRLGTSFADVASKLVGIARELSGTPTEFKLSQNFPNPFNPVTQIDYSIVNSGYTTLKVYNILGQEVKTLFAGYQNVGNYRYSFNASNLASGVYIYRLETGNNSITKKMILMK